MIVAWSFLHKESLRLNSVEFFVFVIYNKLEFNLKLMLGERYMTYKAIISDLDGTLLNSKHRISTYTKEVIKKVIEKGIHFYIATGRHHQDVNHIRNQLGLDTTFITSNGCRVHNAKKEEIFASDLDESKRSRCLWGWF